MFGEYAYPVSFPASLLFFTLITWYLGLARLPVLLAVIPFAALFLYFAYRGRYTLEAFCGQKKWAAVFFLFFFAMLAVRFVNPSISYAEKFMDHAFMASIMRQPVVPPLDPWFLGGTQNVYYYLGYWTFGTFALVSEVPSTIAFNLALPTVLGMSAVLLFALGRLLTERFAWLALATLLLVNPSFVWQVIQGKAIGSVLWDSTRTIHNTINEYPLFSFLWGDVHPHVIGIFNQVFLLFLLVYTWKRWRGAGMPERWILIGLSSLSLGSMPLINTWDVLVYAPVTLFFGLIVWYESGIPTPTPGAGNPAIVRNSLNRISAGVKGFLTDAERRSGFFALFHPKRFPRLGFAYLVLVPLLAVAVYLPFYMQMETQGIQGVGIVHTPTSPAEFLLVHGFFLALIILYLAGDIRARPWLLLGPVPIALAGYPAAAIASIPLVYLLARRSRSAADVLAILGLLILILCEFFYLKDYMGETYFRMNTLFKFYIAAWLILGISSSVMLASVLARYIRPGVIPARVSQAVLVTAAATLILLPLVVPLDSPYRDATLDGLAYLRTAHPGDSEAVAFLRGLPGNPGLVEAEGGDYTYYSRVSSFTGIPAVIGMPFHEFMWRGEAGGWYGQRLSDVRAIYEQPEQTADLMRRYNATLLYVGDPERQKYTIRVEEAGLPILYDRGGVRIYTLPE